MAPHVRTENPLLCLRGSESRSDGCMMREEEINHHLKRLLAACDSQRTLTLVMRLTAGLPPLTPDEPSVVLQYIQVNLHNQCVKINTDEQFQCLKKTKNSTTELQSRANVQQIRRCVCDPASLWQRVGRSNVPPPVQGRPLRR